MHCKDHLDYGFALSGLPEACGMGREAELRDRYKSSSLQYATAIMLRSKVFASQRAIPARNSIGRLILDIQLIFVRLPLFRSGALMLNLTCTEMCAVHICTSRLSLLDTQKCGNDAIKPSAIKILSISSTRLALDARFVTNRYTLQLVQNLDVRCQICRPLTAPRHARICPRPSAQSKTGRS